MQEKTFGMWLSPVRALVWGARGRQFESAHPDKSFHKLVTVAILWSCNVFIYSNLERVPTYYDHKAHACTITVDMSPLVGHLDQGKFP